MLWVLLISLLVLWILGLLGRVGGSISHLLLFFAAILAMVNTLIHRATPDAARAMFPAVKAPQDGKLRP
jgi:hypothetical protein